MNAADESIKQFIESICEKRGGANWFDRFESDTIRSGNIEIQLDIVATEPARPTLVFMPGTNAYAMVYGEFLAAIADRGFNIVGFDPRGHGRSSGARGSYTMPELMDDMRAALDYARDRFDGPLVAGGSSQGGITAFYLAAEGYPMAGALCHNIADLNDPTSVQLSRFPTMSRIMKPLILALARVLPEWKVPMEWYIKLANEPIRGLGSSRDLVRHGTMLVPYVRLKGIASLATEPLPCPVEDIRTPVMLIHGENDLIFPTAYLDPIFDRLRCPKQKYVCPGAHHYVLFDEVPQLIDPVCAWLEDICAEEQ